jgi:hypothetical protein
LLLPPWQSSDVAVPAQKATPEQVVRAYLAALNAHDCSAARAMSIEDAKDSTKVWCRDVASLADVTVKDHFAERPSWSGHPASVQVARVPVDFNLDWRPFHNDGSLAEGKTAWGYLLERPSTDAPWRIFDQGTG